MSTGAAAKRHASSAEQADYTHILKLRDGRRVLIELPGKWVVRDRGGEIGFLPPAVRMLDRVQVLANSLERPSSGYLATLRKALGLTQEELGQRIGVAKMTVSRWERGAVNPSPKSLKALEGLRRRAVRKGILVET